MKRRGRNLSLLLATLIFFTSLLTNVRVVKAQSERTEEKVIQFENYFPSISTVNNDENVKGEREDSVITTTLEDYEDELEEEPNENPLDKGETDQKNPENEEEQGEQENPEENKTDNLFLEEKTSEKTQEPSFATLADGSLLILTKENVTTINGLYSNETHVGRINIDESKLNENLSGAYIEKNKAGSNFSRSFRWQNI